MIEISSKVEVIEESKKEPYKFNPNENSTIKSSLIVTDEPNDKQKSVLTRL